MEKNIFYLKLVGFLLIGYLLAHGTFFLYITWQSFAESELLTLMWLTGAPQIVLLLLVIAVASIIIYIASFINWIVGQRIVKKEMEKNKQEAEDATDTTIDEIDIA